MRLVIALGGNALLRRDQAASFENLRANIATAASQLARVARMARAAGPHQLLITHGNGPQVGLMALQTEAYAALNPAVPAYPLDMLGAETQGLLGYLLEQALANALPATQAVVSVVTRVEVDPADPALAHPSKPIGPVYPAAQAPALVRRHGWVMGPDGAGVRRLVPSPAPLRVPVLPALAALLAQGAVVIAAGGGGIPVVRGAGSTGLQGIEAVIDKDHCSALLAIALHADVLLIATDVDGVMRDWGLPTQALLAHATPAELAQQSFVEGSMSPKVAAACAFVAATGRRAVIGPLNAIEALLAGRAGTQVSLNPPSSALAAGGA
jgi:carbamate kinase